jgi:general stress protein 26
MAKHPQTRVWDVVENVGICMLATRFRGGLRARPLEARPDRDRGVIHFLIDVRGAKDDEIAAAPEVCLIFVDPKEKVYLSLSGHAEVVRDIKQIASLWNANQQVWWPGGPRDPNVRLLRVEPELAEFWDGPASPAVVTHEFAKARATGRKPNLGEKRKVRVTMRS